MASIGQFPGFPARSEATPVPAAFFTEVLPQVEDLAELKVLLVALRRIRQRKGAVRWVAASEMDAAPELGALGPLRLGSEPALSLSKGQASARSESRLVGTPSSERAVAIQGALAAAVARGVLLAIPLGRAHPGPPERARPEPAEGGVAEETAYFLNDAEGRRAVDLVRAGAVSLGLPPAPTPPAPEEAVNIFRLYEDVIGPVPGAGLAEELKEAEQRYPAGWVREAFQEAAAHNVRRWTYIRAILARWHEEGRGDGTTGGRAAPARYRAGKYGRVVRS